jgi:hypothetical protein
MSVPTYFEEDLPSLVNMEMYKDTFPPARIVHHVF